MLTLAEFTQWTGISTLETFLRSIAILVSSILLVGNLFYFIEWIYTFQVLKVENYLPLRFLHVFLPLFMADALTLYFHFIVFIRTVVDGRQIKSAISG